MDFLKPPGAARADATGPLSDAAGATAGVGLPGFLQGGSGDSQDPNDLAQHHGPNNWGPIWAGLRTTLTALLLLSLFGLAVGLSAINVGATAQGSVAAGRPSNQGRIPR